MISEAYLSQIEDYVLNRMTPLEKEVFEYEISVNKELASEVKFQQTLFNSLTRKEGIIEEKKEFTIKRYILPYLSIAAVILTLLYFSIPLQNTTSNGFGKPKEDKDNRTFSYFVETYSKDTQSILDTLSHYSLNLEPGLDVLYSSNQFPTLLKHLSDESQNETTFVDSLYLGLVNFYLEEFNKSALIFEELIERPANSIKELKTQEISRWYCILSYLNDSNPEKHQIRVLELMRYMVENEQPFNESEAAKLFEKLP